MNFTLKRIALCATVLSATLGFVGWAQRASAQQSSPASSNHQIVDNLNQLPQIPLKNFPTVILTAEVQQQFAAAGTPLPAEASLGQELRPEDIFRIGNFEPFGLGDASLEQLAQQTGTSLEQIAMAQMTEFFEQVTLEKLLQSGALPELANLSLQEIPALKALLSEGERLGLGSLSSVNPSTTVKQLLQQVPELGNISFAELSPQQLQQLSVAEAIPGLSGLALNRIDGVEALPIRSLNALEVPSLSLGQMPKPMQLVSNVQLGVADVALGDPGTGDREQQRLRVISGGIKTRDKKLTGVRCPGDSCPHFEFALPTGGAENGAAWMDGSTSVPDGFGPLCQPFGCKGPAGNHPFGSGVRVQLRNIDQAQGTAQVSLSFAYCRRIPFVGKSCTPWIFPLPTGLPIGTVQENTVVPFAAPQQFD